MRGAVRLLIAALAALLLLSGCGGDLQTPGEALRLFGEDLPRAFLGEPFEAPVRAVGGLRPFDFEVMEGKLPDGLELVNGTIRGTPGKTGTFEFTVAVSDANLSRTFREYRLVVVERPPPRLTLELPATEVREPVTVRVRVQDASTLRAASALIEWDAQRFELVADSPVPAADGIALLWEEAPGRLQLDLAALGRAWDGELVLARFTLVPVAPAPARALLSALLIDDRGRHHFQPQAQRAPAAPDAEEDPAEQEEPDEIPTNGDGEAEPAPGEDGSVDDVTAPDDSGDGAVGEDDGGSTEERKR